MKRAAAALMCLVGPVAFAACGGSTGDAGAAPQPVPTADAGTASTPATCDVPVTKSPLPACSASTTETCVLVDVVDELMNHSISVAYGVPIASALVVDDADVFFTAGAVLFRVPKDGHAPATKLAEVVSPSAQGEVSSVLAVDARFVYWSAGDLGLSRVPKAGGDLALVTTEALIASRFAVDATSVYIAGQGGSGPGLYQLPLAGGPAVNRAPLSCTDLAVDATDIYCRSAGGLYRVPIAGGAPQLVNALTGLRVALLQGSPFIEQTQGSGFQLLRVSPSDGAAVALDTGGGPFPGSLLQMAGFGGLLYILDYAGVLRRVSLDGSLVKPLQAQTFSSGVGTFAVDASGVYFTDSERSCPCPVYTPSMGRGDPGSSSCILARSRYRILRAPLLF